MGQKKHLSINSIYSYLKSDLSEDEELEIDEHIAGCEECLKKFVSLERLIFIWKKMTFENLL